MRILKNPQTINRYFKKYDLNATLNEDMKMEIELCEFDNGEIIMEAGDKLDHYYFFLEGKLKIFQRQRNGRNLLIEFYTKFDTLGDVELMQELDVTCTVSSMSKSYLFRIDAEKMKRFASNHPPFLHYMINSLSAKLRNADQNYAYNLLNPVRDRLASYILWHQLEGEDRVILSDSLIDISEYIGTTYRQLNRAINQLEEEGLIRKEGKKIRIINELKLKKLAGNIYRIY